MLPLMRRASEDRHTVRRIDGSLERGFPHEQVEPPWIRLDHTRPLIIGVLPHTQCNPRVAGCGFCTFPHEPYSKPTLRRTVESVAERIEGTFTAHPELARRRIDGLYFGGATANLTPPALLRDLGSTLSKHLDLRGAEVTLEGVPSLFRTLLEGPFEVLRDLPARTRRISMGVQTFDPLQLARMGRQGFGDRRIVGKVVEKAHHHGMTASGDFLVNLPHQSRTQMLSDMQQAAAMGFDQICVYNLVLAEGMGTPWASDASLLSALPSVDEASANWLAVRDWLLANDFVQTTLTNFERKPTFESERRFVYEEHSFTPQRYDALGFGPHAISTFVDVEQRRAVKHVNGASTRSQERDLYFAYAADDLRLLYVTRGLARLSLDRTTFIELFGADLAESFGDVIDAIVEEKLADLDARSLTLTPRGMTYADSVAGLFASARVEQLRATAAGKHTADALGERMIVDFMG